MKILKNKDKIKPAFLDENYPYKAVGESLTDLDKIKPEFIYEIKCNKCEMSIRSQGKNIKSIYERINKAGCIGCGKRELIIKQINMEK